MNRSVSDEFHLPVLAEEVVTRLLTNTDGTYLDLTAGGGGHLLAICNRLSGSGRLYGVDRDPEAVKEAKARLRQKPQLRKIVQGRFGDVEEIVSGWKDRKFNGILLDVGVSSAQIDRGERGFSYQSDGPLDMRMDPGQDLTAAEFLANVDEKELTRILRAFGEERQSARIAKRIVMERQKTQITSTSQLADIVRAVALPPHQTKSIARVFQAIRIYINRELDQLMDVLPKAVTLLVPSGRLAVVSYHSLEDRIVKRFFKKQSHPVCTCPPGLAQCLCGAVATLRVVTSRPVRATKEEIAINPRARSARLRVGERI